jgi:hypothetical protein
MNITRVDRDGVEFFTVDETGESGMSESGLARLCGVSPVSIHKFVSSSALTWDQEKALNPAFRKTIAFKPGSGKNLKSSQNSNIKILSALVCARVIRHYALESKYKTQEALFTLDKFSTAGITAWIQEITHWHGNPAPKTGIAIDYQTIDLLMDKRLDGSSYRVYLVLQKAIRLRMTLTADEILERAGISRSAYTTAVTKLDELGLLPDWCKIQRKNHPERIVRDRLQAQLGGKVEAYTKFGLIDLLTETELIEIKIVNRWKDAIGHILAKSEKYPNHQKRLHLFGYQEPVLENIEEVCDRLGIRVTFEMVEKTDRALVIA